MHVPRVEPAGRGTARRMNPISTLAGITRGVLKAPIALATSAVRLVRSATTGAEHPQATPGPTPAPTPAPDVEISPDRPVNVTEELGLDPSPVAKPKGPRRTTAKPVTAIDAEADASEVDVTPADVAEAVSHRARATTDE